MSTLGIITLVIISILLGFFINAVIYYARQGVKVGDPAPGFYAELLDGSPIGHSTWKRPPNPILLCFVSPKCMVCRRMAILLDELNSKYPKANLDVILLGIHHEGEKFKTWEEDLNIHLPLAIDKKGTSKMRYMIYSLPAIFYISTDGIIQKIHKGFHEGDDEMLESIFRENMPK